MADHKSTKRTTPKTTPQQLFLRCGEPMPQGLDAFNQHLESCQVCQHELGPAPREAELTERQEQDHRAVRTLANKLTELRLSRDEGWKELLFTSRYLIVTSLPYEPTKEPRITHSIRLPDGSRLSITFTAMSPDAPLPYGSDRTLLHWLLDRLTRQLRRHKSDPEKATFISWHHAAEYLREMKMSDHGKNLRDLRERWMRCSNLGIAWTYHSPERARLKAMVLIEDAHLPSSIEAPSMAHGQTKLPLTNESEVLDLIPFGVRFSKPCIEFFMKNPVPLPKQILIATRRKSQLQDLMIYLTHRIYACRKPTLIPWEEVRAQLWQADRTLRRIKVRMREAINALHVIWPELQAEVRPQGLWIASPKHGHHFLPQGGSRRQLNT